MKLVDLLLDSPEAKEAYQNNAHFRAMCMTLKVGLGDLSRDDEVRYVGRMVAGVICKDWQRLFDLAVRCSERHPEPIIIKGGRVQ